MYVFSTKSLRHLTIKTHKVSTPKYPCIIDGNTPTAGMWRPLLDEHLVSSILRFKSPEAMVLTGLIGVLVDMRRTASRGLAVEWQANCNLPKQLSSRRHCPGPGNAPSAVENVDAPTHTPQHFMCYSVILLYSARSR